jgi:hypothetical protein
MRSTHRRSAGLAPHAKPCAECAQILGWPERLSVRVYVRATWLVQLT